MNALIAYITNCVLYLSGASQDPRMLLPAWVSIATVHLPTLVWDTRIQPDKATDIDDALSPVVSNNQHSQGNFCFYQCLIYRKLPEFVYPAFAAAFDP